MNTQLPQKQLLLIAFFGGLVFYAPVALLVRTQAGITVSQFFLLQMILSVTVLLTEVPAGYISDKIGYKNSYILSTALLLAARILLLCARSFPLFALEAVLEGISASVISGASSAYLYSFCKGEEYTVFCSKTGRAGTIGFILSTLCYSLILKFTNITGLVAATCLTTLFSFVTTLLLPKERPAEKTEEAKETKNITLFLLKASLIFFVIMGALSVADLVINFFYAVKLERIGIGYEYMSLLIFGYSAVELITPAILKHIKATAYRGVIIAMLLASALAFFCIFAFDSFIALPLMLLIPLFLSLIGYLTDELVNESIDKNGLEKKRATVLSVMNIGTNLLEIVFLFSSAILSENEGNVAFLFVGLYLAIIVMGFALYSLSTHGNKKKASV